MCATLTSLRPADSADFVSGRRRIDRGARACPNHGVIEMEDSRCKIVATETDDPRCKGLLIGVVTEMEDLRCKSLLDRVVLEIEDPRHNRVVIGMEDSRCRNLLIIW